MQVYISEPTHHIRDETHSQFHSETTLEDSKERRNIKQELRPTEVVVTASE